MSKTFKESVEAFETANEGWLEDSHQPALSTLYLIADRLDGKDFNSALLGQFGLTYRHLLSLAPGAAQEVDPVDALIEKIREDA